MKYEDKIYKHTQDILAGKSGYGAENPTGETQWTYPIMFALVVLLPLIGLVL